MKRTFFSLVAILWVCSVASPHTQAHPGSGIVVDTEGQVFFVDTGFGVWKIDRQLRLTPQKGEAWHWMSIDRGNRVSPTGPLKVPEGDLAWVGLAVLPKQRLLLSSSFPAAVGPDGSVYFPEVARNGRVQIMQLAPSGRKKRLAILPVAEEIDPTGKKIQARWIHGLVVNSRGVVYYTERFSIRKISPDGQVSPVAEDIRVPDCVRPPAMHDDRLGPSLYGLDVAADGTVYVAAPGCCAVLKVWGEGEIGVVMRAKSPWAPTGVAVYNQDLYVLEYTYIQTTQREDWLPRVRKVAPDGQVTTIVTVDKAVRANARN